MEQFRLTFFRCPCDWKEQVVGIKDERIKARRRTTHVHKLEENTEAAVTQRSAVAPRDICDNR